MKTDNTASVTIRSAALRWMLLIVAACMMPSLASRLAAQTITAQQLVGTWERRTPAAAGTVTSVQATFRPDGSYFTHLRILYPDNTVKSDFGHRNMTGRWQIKGDIIRVDQDARPGLPPKAYFYRYDEHGRLVMVGENVPPLIKISG